MPPAVSCLAWEICGKYLEGDARTSQPWATAEQPMVACVVRLVDFLSTTGGPFVSTFLVFPAISSSLVTLTNGTTLAHAGRRSSCSSGEQQCSTYETKALTDWIRERSKQTGARSRKEKTYFVKCDLTVAPSRKKIETRGSMTYRFTVLIEVPYHLESIPFEERKADHDAVLRAYFRTFEKRAFDEKTNRRTELFLTSFFE